MNPPSMEVIFLILSGAILMAGILYWFWSHIQLTQKKVQLLENAVFELRGMMGSRTGGGDSPAVPAAAVAAAPYADLADEEEWDAPVQTVHEMAAVEENSNGVTVVREGISEDLMPGGAVGVAAAVVAEEPKTVDLHALVKEEEQFRELFIAPSPGTGSGSNSVTGPSASESLESMPVKELRRLAEQRGVAGAADMRKKDLLIALRQQVSSQAAAPVVEVERTMDIAEMVEELPMN